MYLSEAVKLYAVKSVVTQNQYYTKLSLSERLSDSGNRVNVNFPLINELYNMEIIRENSMNVKPDIVFFLVNSSSHTNKIHMKKCNYYLTLLIFSFI
jgi:hypothetical protein